jgi:hypothetical protein
MKNFVLFLEHKALQILDESFLLNFDRFSCLSNFYKPMIFIVKTKNRVCQCVSSRAINQIELINLAIWPSNSLVQDRSNIQTIYKFGFFKRNPIFPKNRISWAADLFFIFLHVWARF